MKTLNAIKLVSRFFMLKLNQVNSDSTVGYDAIAASYDTYSKYFEPSVAQMVEELPIKPGQYILDLACGTGIFTHPIAQKVGEQGKVVAVDLSIGMLQRNQENAAFQGLSNISFVPSDVCSFLSGISDNSVDGIVCGWGMSHMEHGQLIQEVQRVVKPGGFIGLIEDKANSLKDVADLFTKALIDYPDALIKNFSLNLPKNKDYLVKLLAKQRFHVQKAWEEEMVIPCHNGQEVAEYMLKSTDVGFVDALDEKLFPQVLQTFISDADERFAKGWEHPLLHKFCAIVGTKV